MKGTLQESSIEVIRSDIERGHIRHALFDFDGTISLIREGWQEIMETMMVEILMETPEHESQEAIARTVIEFITELTGKQTIYQMIQLCEEIAARGGQPEDPLDYKEKYHKRLLARIQDRLNGLESKQIDPEEMVVPGSLEMLERIKEKGVVCYLASGTDEKYVVHEAGLLGITAYFDGVYGAQDDYKNFSKRKVIQRIIQENNLKGPELVAFGDGYVEIEDTNRVGGITVGVATNEETKTGINEWKRARLMRAGADVIIPDFRQHDILLNYLFPEG
jgi:phosphoglycolate phosphatase-like HAD superfamily hydrolase